MIMSVRRFALIGAGAFARSAAPAIRDSERSDLVAAVDPVEGAAASLAPHPGAAYRDLDAMLAEQRPDAAWVCTPPATHESICRVLLDQGVAALCEKPLTLESGAAHRMQRRSNPRQIAISAKFRHLEEVAAARQLLHEGALGAPVFAEVVFSGFYPAARNWRSDPTQSGGGVLADNGPHAFDLLGHVLGPLSSVSAKEGPRRQGLAVEETVQLTVRTRSGVLATVLLSWTVDAAADYYLKVVGEQGVIEVGWRNSRWKSGRTQDWKLLGNGYEKTRALRRQVDAFCRMLDGQPSATATLAEGCASVCGVEAAYRSLRTGKTEAIAKVLHYGPIADRGGQGP